MGAQRSAGSHRGGATECRACGRDAGEGNSNRRAAHRTDSDQAEFVPSSRVIVGGQSAETIFVTARVRRILPECRQPPARFCMKPALLRWVDTRLTFTVHSLTVGIRPPLSPSFIEGF